MIKKGLNMTGTLDTCVHDWVEHWSQATGSSREPWREDLVREKIYYRLYQVILKWFRFHTILFQQIQMLIHQKKRLLNVKNFP